MAHLATPLVAPTAVPAVCVPCPLWSSTSPPHPTKFQPEPDAFRRQEILVRDANARVQHEHVHASSAQTLGRFERAVQTRRKSARRGVRDAVEVPLRRGQRRLRVRARRRRPSARRRRRRRRGGGVRKREDFRVLLDDLNLRRVRAMKRAFLRRRQTDERRGSKPGRVRAKPRRDGKRCTLGETRRRGANVSRLVRRRRGWTRLHLARYLAERLGGDVGEKPNDVRAGLVASRRGRSRGRGRRSRFALGFAGDTPEPSRRVPAT